MGDDFAKHYKIVKDEFCLYNGIILFYAKNQNYLYA